MVRLPNPTLVCAGAATVLSVAAPATGQNLSVTEIWSSERVRNLVLSAAEGVAEAPDGRIWISDPMAMAVYAVDTDGNTFTRIAREGEGPGEVEGPDRIAITPDGNLAVFDYAKIEVYTPAGEPVRRVKLVVEVVWPKGFAALPDGGFAISGGIMTVSAPIHRFDADGNLIRSWGEPSPALGFRERMVGGGGALYAAPDGLMYTQSAPHRITLYDYDEEGPEQGRTLAELPGTLVHPGDGVIVESGSGSSWRRTFRPYFPQSRAVFPLEDDRFLNVVVFKDDGYSLWQVFGRPGKLLEQARVDEAYMPWFRCRDGTILATRMDPATDIPTVTRLRVATSVIGKADSPR